MSLESRVPRTPCYVVDISLLRRNLETLSDVQERSGCRILLALKGFSMFSLFPVIKQYLAGTSASSLDEARLGYEEFGRDVHVCAPAYRPDDFGELLGYASHLIFNSMTQWRYFKDDAQRSGRDKKFGLRINPQHSEVKTLMYDPCAPGSRLGITADALKGQDTKGITGLHFHTLCELGADALERTLAAVADKFETELHRAEWVNFGGGHHITRPGYDVEALISMVSGFSDRYGVDVYLEPGEAVVLNTGFFVTTVLDIIHNGSDIAILDTSAAAHMPDVLEMPYRPGIVGAGGPGELPYTYRLGGMTCLAGDIIGDYSFRSPLKAGDRLVFTDMAHYTMVKNNTFNGIRLPDIGIYDPDTDKVEVVRRFGYADYKARLS